MSDYKQNKSISRGGLEVSNDINQIADYNCDSHEKHEFHGFTAELVFS